MKTLRRKILSQKNWVGSVNQIDYVKTCSGKTVRSEIVVGLATRATSYYS